MIKFYRVQSASGLFRLGGGDLVGIYAKGQGKIWHSLSSLKNHYLQCLKKYCYLLNIDYKTEKAIKESDRFLELMPNNIVIEYKLVEVNRFPAKNLFKSKGQCKCSLDEIIKRIADTK